MLDVNCARISLSDKMVDKNGTKKGVERMVEYLASPEIVNRMIIASELGLPALTLIARDLESKFDENSTFPVVVFEMMLMQLRDKTLGVLSNSCLESMDMFRFLIS